MELTSLSGLSLATRMPKKLMNGHRRQALMTAKVFVSNLADVEELEQRMAVRMLDVTDGTYLYFRLQNSNS
jgi:hypothetical protein